MKSLSELKKGGSKWQEVLKMKESAVNKIEILPKNDVKANEILEKMQLPLNTFIGTIIAETGGILVDNGWIRILGSGSQKLGRTIYDWNLERSYDAEDENPGFILIADDVLGGLFAINNGALGEDIDSLYYLAPDTIEWESLEVPYEGFLQFCFEGGLNDFYGDARWTGWQKEVETLHGDEAILILPPLWAEGPDDLAEREHQVIPMDEMFAVIVEAEELLNDAFIDMEESEHGCGCGHDHSCDDDCDDNSCGCGCGDECDCDEEDCDCDDDCNCDCDK